ncbi:hypothetical protein M408DRAFT_328237 [Serendipita vermifera MAFF 305830]|uniref:CAP-Gly domain-containing protein n=1 Tax=Serendipita vermifera MAFF 305830 TaxID=933852 RepID=A0A0C2WX83_SERVB|nr:hypothetical protein M408DRAFT_328237 [Serendipita vermifera MAFF 305830]
MSQLPTPGLPKPRVSGIGSIAKSALPAPGIRARSTTANGGASPIATGNVSAIPSTPSEKDFANGTKRTAGRVSNAGSVPASPVTGLSKPGFGAVRPQPSSYSKASFSSNAPRASIGRPPSSASASSSRQGDRAVPVTPPRRQSTAYGSGSAVRISSTPRSSVHSRSESRQSDAFTRDSSRASERPLEVGDPVKIESLGLEGTLRFLGEIAGKPGHWAGVELSGQYAGKGKNDGSVAGVAYFSCPPKCGVFVASTKIAAMPMAPPSARRPSSVASSLASPTDTRQRKVSSAEASMMAQSKITAGSRASKYIGITAKQLSNRDLNSLSQAPQGSPRKSLAPMSPPRPLTINTTQTTPKAPRASLGLKPRTSISSATTPRPGRLQLAAAKSDMPPPPVPDRKSEPVTPTLSHASNDSSYMEEGLQDMPALTFSNGVSPSPSPSQSGRSSVYATPSPEPSHLIEIQRLQEVVQTLEGQIKELKEAVPAAAPAPVLPENDEAKIQLEEQNAAALKRASELEASLHASERSSIEKQGKIEALERTVAEIKEDIVKARAEGDIRVKEVKTQLEESETLITSLKGLIDDKASAASENDANLSAKQAEIDVLRAQVARVTSDLEQERKELGSHVDELRRAGQETIALYEERISAFEAERYDAEALVQSLEEKLRQASHQPSPEELSKKASTAAEIDNETLREQVAHLQQRISHLEDQLEDAQVIIEREEEAAKTRIARYKEKDVQRQQELEELRLLAANSAKSESAARTRIEELEEAFRENTSTLEDARAEIESLRTDLTNLENSTELSAEERAAARASQTAATEAKHLKALLDASKLETRATADQLAAAKSQTEEVTLLVSDLRDLVSSLEKEKADLLKTLSSKSKDDSKRNRDSGSSVSSRTKDDNLRDQIAGLKIMMQELQKENSSLANKCRSLESENKLLLGETEDLKEAIKTLELAVDESIQREERLLEEEENGAGNKEEPSQKSLRESRTELDAVRKKLADVERKNAKTISELNKEVADLESLVEAKIYREDDLEREVERLKDKVQRLQAKNASKSASAADAKSSSRSNHTRSSTVTQQTVAKEEPSALVCEICEQSGHDIFSCPLLKDDESAATTNGSSAEAYCVDCDTKGHSTAECPYAQDVF